MKSVLAEIWDAIRLAAAGCFFFVVILVIVAICSSVHWRIPFVLDVLLASGGFLLLVWVVYKLFGGKERAGFNKQAFIDKLDSAEKLEAVDYKARRAFEVEQLEDEGNHFYIELEDGSTLFLTGQFLWDYVPSFDEPRRFPCTEFTLKLFDEDDVAKIDCRGEVLEPEVVFPPFNVKDYESELMPDNCEIVTSLTYDELKQNRGRLKREEQSAEA